VATTTPTVNDAAKVVIDTEVSALTAISDALTVFDNALVAVQQTLPNGLTLDAARIINELRSQHGYRRVTELPALLGRYAQSDTPSIPVMPAGTGNG
jgi:hypothetical protein